MRPRELVKGNCYFHVTFAEEGMHFPLVQTLFYRSVTNDEDGVRRWLFEDPPSLERQEDEGNPDGSPALYGYSDDQLVWILDFPGLVKVLGEVAADHHFTLSGPGGRLTSTRQRFPTWP
jgi:hypothetical protein